MDDQQFRQLLRRLGLSWSGYRRVRKGVKKRIRRHMQQLGYKSVAEYMLALDKDQELRLQCEKLMSVSVSRFFRDRGLWQILGDHVLPNLVAMSRERVMVWSAGCACGEEAYTFKILWDLSQGHFQHLPALEVWATDLNPLYLDRARAGIYPRSSLREVTENIRSTYFEPLKGARQYRVAPSLRKGIWWEVHNLLHDPPAQDFHLIFLRNSLLTYYSSELKEPAFRKLVDRLLPGGFLIIGSHEKIPLLIENLNPLSKLSYIMQRSD